MIEKKVCFSHRVTELRLFSCPSVPCPTLVSLSEFSALGLFSFLRVQGFGVGIECGFYRFPECFVHCDSSLELPRKGGLRERAQRESSEAQEGRCWECCGMKVRLLSGKLRQTFQQTPLYLLICTQGRAFSLEDHSHFRNSLIPVHLEHPLPSSQQKRLKHHFNPNISLFATEAMHSLRDERNC